MKFSIEYFPHILQFKNPSGTSRGIYTSRLIILLKLTVERDKKEVFYGECAPLPGLSIDYFSTQYANVLQTTIRYFEQTKGEIPYNDLTFFPSICLGFEMLKLQLKKGASLYYPSAFTEGVKGIPTNGLIWMGTIAQMQQQAEQKIEQGFTCLKFKIGALNFDKELYLIKRLRELYPNHSLTFRVDANGAFTPEEALQKMEQLANLKIHSIEQPIAPKQYAILAELCKKTPLPIALDEELIGICTLEEKIRLLEEINPQYLILKPSLHGGFKGCNEWISLAKERNIGFWITSALESNLGLNAISQWTATVSSTAYSLPQGLGTGGLYTNNFESLLYFQKDQLFFNNQQK